MTLSRNFNDPQGPGKGINDAVDDGGNTVLLLALRRGADLDEVRKIVDAGADVNLANKMGQPPLHHAILFCSAAHVKLLLDAGAKPDMRDRSNGWMPVHAAARRGDRAILDLVAQADGYRNLNAESDGRMRWTPMHVAVVYQNDNIVEALGDLGADANRLDSNDETPLQLAARYNNAQILENLIKAGADLDKSGQDPLINAVKFGSADVAEVLLKAGADPNRHGSDGLTPLHHAAQSHNPDMIDMLVRFGAEVNARTQHTMETPLMVAARMGMDRNIERLIDCRAALWLKDTRGNTALDIARGARRGPRAVTVLEQATQNGGSRKPPKPPAP